MFEDEPDECGIWEFEEVRGSCGNVGFGVRGIFGVLAGEGKSEIILENGFTMQTILKNKLKK